MSDIWLYYPIQDVLKETFSSRIVILLHNSLAMIRSPEIFKRVGASGIFVQVKLPGETEPVALSFDGSPDGVSGRFSEERRSSRTKAPEGEKAVLTHAPAPKTRKDRMCVRERTQVSV